MNLRPVATRLLTLVVLSAGLLLGGQAHGQSDRSGQLQLLVNELGGQLQLVKHHNHREADRRLQQLAVALDRWNNSGRSEQDLRTMQEWLEASIRASLPGRSKKMPELPRFSMRPTPAEIIPRPQTPNPAEVSTAAESRPARTPTQSAMADTKPQEQNPASPDSKATPNSESRSTIASVWQRHPAAQPIDLGDPFADDEPAGGGNTTHVTLRPVASSIDVPQSRVRVNSAELEARLRGYVYGLQAVEARLLASSEMTGEQLLLVLRELEQLTAQRKLVSLYVDTLALDQPERSQELPTISNAKSMASRRLEQLRQSTETRPQMLDAIQQLLREL